MRRKMIMASPRQDSSYGSGQAVPGLHLFAQKFPAALGDAVVLCLAIVLGGAPGRRNRGIEFEAIERWIKRPLFHLQDLVGEQVDRLRDRISVKRTALEGVK